MVLFEGAEASEQADEQFKGSDQHQPDTEQPADTGTGQRGQDGSGLFLFLCSRRTAIFGNRCTYVLSGHVPTYV